MTAGEFSMEKLVQGNFFSSKKCQVISVCWRCYVSTAPPI